MSAKVVASILGGLLAVAAPVLTAATPGNDAVESPSAAGDVRSAAAAAPPAMEEVLVYGTPFVVRIVEEPPKAELAGQLRELQERLKATIATGLQQLALQPPELGRG